MGHAGTRILLVEDDERICTMLGEALPGESYDLTVARDMAAARLRVDEGFDLILLDLGLPDGDGLGLCQELRDRADMTPVLILTARNAPNERVRGLEAGADDYLTKPFHLPELEARMSAILRRTQGATPTGRLEWSDIWIDPNTRQAGVGDQHIELKRREFDLLLFLVRHPDRAWTRTQLLDRVWGPDRACDERAVDLNIARLRAQVEKNAERPRCIQTVWGVGYRLAETS
jgi:DNA-binding response OmpR family regulator